MKLMNHSDPLDRLFISAGFNIKRDWQVYELYKQQIKELGLSSNDYNEAIKKLSDILEV